MNDRITLNPEEFATLAICAIRYCHGRQTYMPSLVQGIIRPHFVGAGRQRFICTAEGLREHE